MDIEERRRRNRMLAPNVAELFDSLKEELGADIKLLWGKDLLTEYEIGTPIDPESLVVPYIDVEKLKTEEDRKKELLSRRKRR